MWSQKYYCQIHVKYATYPQWHAQDLKAWVVGEGVGALFKTSPNWLMFGDELLLNEQELNVTFVARGKWSIW